MTTGTAPRVTSQNISASTGLQTRYQKYEHDRNNVLAVFIVKLNAHDVSKLLCPVTTSS